MPYKRNKKPTAKPEHDCVDDFDIWDDDEDLFEEQNNKKALKAIPKELIDPAAGKHPVELIWGLRKGEVEETNRNAKMFSMKHGMLAGVPLICKDDECKFIDVCTVDRLYRRKKMRCPMEIAALISRLNYYCLHFEVGLSDEILPEEVTDLTLIRQLCDLEIQILRADNKIAIDGDFIVRNLVDETKKSGLLIYEEKISPATTFKIELYNKHNKILQLLAATRKDKVNIAVSDASVQASELMRKIKELGEKDIINVSLEEDELVNDDGSINYGIINKFAESGDE
jgi:hypothetical protein